MNRHEPRPEAMSIPAVLKKNIQDVDNRVIAGGEAATQCRALLRAAFAMGCQDMLTATDSLSRCLDKVTAAKQEHMVTLVRDATGRDPADGLAAVAALAGLLEVLEALHVERARRSGWSWEAIAQRLGVSRQAVHQKHGDLDERKQRLGKRARR